MDAKCPKCGCLLEGRIELPNVEELKEWVEKSMGHLNPETRPFLIMGVEALYVKLGGERFIKFG